MITIPERWQEVLRSIQAAGFPEAIIAGGALRDLDHGKPVNDVDIFVRAKDEMEGELKARLDKAFGYEGVGIFADNSTANLDEDYTWEGVIVAGVWDWPLFNTRPFQGVANAPTFQVIAVDTDEKDFLSYIVSDFDIGLCKIAYDGSVIFMPGDYLRDKTDQTLTVVRAPSVEALARTLERVERIRRKYPDHKLVIQAKPGPEIDSFVAISEETPF